MLSFVIVGFVWKLILARSGALRQIMIGLVGLGSWFRPWLGKQSTALTTLALISVWQFVGIPMMLIYAALLAIPDEVLEAARMRRHHRHIAVLQDQAAADPADDRHHLDPDLRRQFQRVRPDLCRRRARSPARTISTDILGTFLYRTLLRQPAAARRPVSWAPPSLAMMFLIILIGVLHLSVRRSAPPAPIISLRRDEQAPARSYAARTSPPTRS